MGECFCEPVENSMDLGLDIFLKVLFWLLCPLLMVYNTHNSSSASYFQASVSYLFPPTSGRYTVKPLGMFGEVF